MLGSDRDRRLCWASMRSVVTPAQLGAIDHARVQRRPNATKRPPTRDGVATLIRDMEALIAKLRRMEQDGELPKIEYGWRTKVCDRLRDWYNETQLPPKPIQSKTLQKRLRIKMNDIEDKQGDKL